MPFNRATKTKLASDDFMFHYMKNEMCLVFKVLLAQKLSQINERKFHSLDSKQKQCSEITVPLSQLSLWHSFVQLLIEIQFLS